MKNYLIKSFKEAIIIVAVVIPLAIGINLFRPDGIPLVKFTNNQSDIQEDKAYKKITVEKAFEVFNTLDNKLFVDARSLFDYNLGHIKGAINFPEHDFDLMIDKFLESIPIDRTIITYCEGLDCHLASDLAEKLVLLGYKNVLCFQEGWEKWQEQGLPFE